MNPDDPGPDLGPAEPTDDLHERFEAFRTLATPPPVAVDELPAVRPPTRRWLPAAAAAVVVLALLSVAVVARTGDTDSDLSTSSPGSSSTTTNPITSTVPGPATAVVPTTVESPATTVPATSSTAPTTGPPTTRATVTTAVPGAGDPVGEDPTTTAPPTTVGTSTDPVGPIPPPAAIPPGAPLPPDSRDAFWSAPDGAPSAGATTFRVRVRYAACASWPFISVDGRPPVPAPTITETADAVVITFFGPYVSPHFGLQSCTTGPDDPGTQTYDVTLSAPLGSRWVYDGSEQRDPSPLLILDPNGRPA